MRGQRVPRRVAGEKADYIRQFNADTLVMGDDWAGRFDSLSYLCEVVYFPRTPSISTTSIIEVVKSINFRGYR